MEYNKYKAETLAIWAAHNLKIAIRHLSCLANISEYEANPIVRQWILEETGKVHTKGELEDAFYSGRGRIINGKLYSPNTFEEYFEQTFKK